MWIGLGESGLPSKAQDWLGEVLERRNMSAVDGARKLGIGLGAEEVGPHFSTCSFKQPIHRLVVAPATCNKRDSLTRAQLLMPRSDNCWLGAGAEERAAHSPAGGGLCERREAEHPCWRRHHKQARAACLALPGLVANPLQSRAAVFTCRQVVALRSTCGTGAFCSSSTAAGQNVLQKSNFSEMACPCCRAHVVGALLGVQHVEKALPAEWQTKAPKYVSVKQMVHVVIVQRRTFVPFHINRDPSQQPDAE